MLFSFEEHVGLFFMNSLLTVSIIKKFWALEQYRTCLVIINILKKYT